MKMIPRVQSLRQARKQKGFTIIELVVVILLLGILAATALPRFMDVTDEAHEAVVSAVQGGLVTGGALFRAQWVANGQLPGVAVSGFGDGDLYPNTSGYPIGTAATFSANSCLQIYNGLLQSGRPAAAATTGTVTGPTALAGGDLGASSFTTAATAANISTAAGTSNDIVAVTGSGIYYCKNDATDEVCLGTGFFDSAADAIASADGTAGADWANATLAQAGVLQSGSCTYYYTGQYRTPATGLSIPSLALSLTNGSISTGTLSFVP